MTGIFRPKSLLQTCLTRRSHTGESGWFIITGLARAAGLIGASTFWLAAWTAAF